MRTLTVCVKGLRLPTVAERDLDVLSLVVVPPRLPPLRVVRCACG